MMGTRNGYVPQALRCVTRFANFQRLAGTSAAQPQPAHAFAGRPSKLVYGSRSEHTH